MNKAALTLPAMLLAALSMKAAEKPNVILVLADDLGYGDISGLNPDSKIFTPNIDRMCKNGIVFTDAHATSSLSTPSRYSILTGRYSWRTSLKEGVLNGYSGAMIAPDRGTMAKMFHEAGYATACIGKWHLGWEWSRNETDADDVDFSKPIANGPTERGFDYFYGIPASLDIAPYIYVENNRVTALPDHTIAPGKGLRLMHGGIAGADFDAEKCFPNIIERSIRYINGQKSADKPFFLYLPITAPHTPILPTAEFKGATKIGVYGDFVVMIDDMMGQLFKALKNNKMSDNTIVIFASDNGCAPYIEVKELERKGHFPSYIYRGYKSDIYEGGHRVPLIISWGSRYSKIVDGSLVSLSDLYATFARMTGYHLADNEAEDSYSLWPVLTREGKSDRRELISLSGNGILAIRTPELKLIFGAGSGGWSYPRTAADMAGLPPMQLYNIAKDPSEKNNVIASPEYAGQVETMTALMRKCIEDGRSTPGVKQHNDTADNWTQTELFMQ